MGWRCLQPREVFDSRGIRDKNATKIETWTEWHTSIQQRWSRTLASCIQKPGLTHKCKTHTHTLTGIHSHTIFSTLLRCQNDCLGFRGRKHISIRLNKPSGTRRCFELSTRGWIIQSDVNQWQPNSDEEVDLINPMVLMQTCLISHRAYQVVFNMVTEKQPIDIWQYADKAKLRGRWGSGWGCGGLSPHIWNSLYGVSRKMLNGYSN